MRDAKFILVIGARGTGKTTVCKKIALQTIKKNRPVLLVVIDRISWGDIPIIEHSENAIKNHTTGLKCLIYEGKETLKLLNLFFNGLLILDDCRTYISNNLPEALHMTLIRLRHHGVDTIAVAHGISDVPVKFFIFHTEIFLFQTSDNLYKDKNRVINHEILIRHQTEVNEIAKTKKYYYRIINLKQ